MKTITLRPAEPELDFEQLVARFLTLEDAQATKARLAEEYKKQKKRIIRKVAGNEQGQLLGFYWAERNKAEPEQFYLYLAWTMKSLAEIECGNRVR